MKKCVFLLFACVLCFPLQATETWLSEEVLQQLKELRSEIRGLRGDVSTLKEEVTSLKTQVANKAPNEGAVKPGMPGKFLVGDAPTRGNKNAKVAVVEFTDFECPYCGRHHRQTFSRLDSDYISTDKIQYIAKDFPLSFHTNGVSSAVAARCAGEQGKYWDMHHALFENQRKLSDSLYKTQADLLGLDASAFAQCLQDPEQKKRVNQDIDNGERYGVRGTPAFLIGTIEQGVMTNLQFVSGAQSYDRFAHILDRLIK